jgi:hypothetical protein
LHIVLQHLRDHQLYAKLSKREFWLDSWNFWAILSPIMVSQLTPVKFKRWWIGNLPRPCIKFVVFLV